jgi:hypothetical protein
MSNREEKITEIVELLKIWNRFNTTCWPGAKEALEERINALCEELGLGKHAMANDEDIFA